MVKDIKKENLKISGSFFKNIYVTYKFQNSSNLYNEIFQFLFSKGIKLLQIQNPKWYYKQILSKFVLKYPLRLGGKDSTSIEKRKRFRKYIETYKLDENNRLCILNPNNSLKQEKEYFKNTL